MQAQNRSIKDWYTRIESGTIKLPRFQRFEAWDRQRISSLIETVIRNLPLGITLILEVGEREQFVSRQLETAPETSGRVTEHLLDGQQRLTALWRTFHNNYEAETYFIYIRKFDEYDQDEEREDLTVYCRSRYYKQTEERYPLWCDDPAQCLKRGFIPTHLLRPPDIQQEIDAWIDAATAWKEPTEGGRDAFKEFYDYQKQVSDVIKELRATVANYNLPFLSLPPATDKSVALNVFIRMNTNSKPLSVYDIIVAEIESIMGQSLHDLQDQLTEECPAVARYADLSDLILTTSALLQDALPNQRGAWDMDKRVMLEKWEVMKRGLNNMAEFLRGEGIFDRQRLPTNAVLAVIAALYAEVPDQGDKRGKDESLLRRYLWRAFFTDRYENAAATRAYADYIALKKVLSGRPDGEGNVLQITDVPIFRDNALVEVNELLAAEWPSRATIRGRGILAFACRMGSRDFSTGVRLDEKNIGGRHYHHIYPDSLLKEAGINSWLALNCALIEDKTNLTIGRKDPLVYMKDRYAWTTEELVDERLHSHLIPVAELANGGYEGLTEEEKKVKLARDFALFLRRRAAIVMKGVSLLVEGRPITAEGLCRGLTPEPEEAVAV